MLVQERYRGGGGFRKDAACGGGAGHSGALDRGRCEEEGDEGVTIHDLIFFHSLLSPQAAGLKPRAMEGWKQGCVGHGEAHPCPSLVPGASGSP